MQKKRIILCFDGTWNNVDSGKAETNVARIARAVRANSGADNVPQLTLYLRGVGSTGLAIQKLVGGAFGEGIDDNIRSGYMFLAQNYVQDNEDEIYIFGFSRGAFTARSLVGFITSSGLLKRQTLDHLANAWEYYRTAADRSPAGFCKKYGSDCHKDVRIRFLGVWDTVGALGIPASFLGDLSRKDYQFHDTTPSKIVEVARHALAIDEHRDEFLPTLWTEPSPDSSDVKQVWFAGAHADVGGGYKDRALADIPLRWMAQEAEEAGLKLDWSMLPQGDANPLAPQHESRLSWSQKDLLTPTIRQIMGAEAELGVLEWLYRPVDEAGEPATPINESLHPSVGERFGREVTVLLDEQRGKSERQRYMPKNLVPLYAPKEPAPPNR